MFIFYSAAQSKSQSLRVFKIHFISSPSIRHGNDLLKLTSLFKNMTDIFIHDILQSQTVHANSEKQCSCVNGNTKQPH